MAPPKSSPPRSIRVRLPDELHDELAAEAKRQNVSLNTLIIALLAGGIGWRAKD